MTQRKNERYVLQNVRGALVLAEADSQSEIMVEFPSYLLSEQGRHELNRQPLIRAIGRERKRVIDATAGMGADCFLLAAFGHVVTGFERSEPVAALLRDGLARSVSDPDIEKILGNRLNFIEGDSIIELTQLNYRPQVIYLDPMYPPRRKKSALPKKELQVLRDLVGDDEDSLKLFEVAREVAAERVVVKRPVYAEPLAEKPSMSYETKLVRFDVYLVPKAITDAA